MFCLDNGAEDPVFYVRGYTDGRMIGGGWACPMLPKERAEFVLRNYISLEQGTRFEYDQANDTFILYPDSQFGTDREEFVGFDIEVNGKQIHAYDLTGWTWYAEKITG